MGQGATCGGNVTQTKQNFTGQKLDDTGLLFYNARYYDPGLGRFTSPDSIVPGASSGVGGAGGMVGEWQNSTLTVDFHEGGFLSPVQAENARTQNKGFWFQLSGNDRNKGAGWGPINPQVLNRYSYVLNNPLRYIDPSGHEPNSDYRILYNDTAGNLVQKLANGDIRVAISADTLKWFGGATMVYPAVKTTLGQK